ncbi:MAG: hypothetical protein R6X12_01025 [bacterium]
MRLENLTQPPFRTTLMGVVVGALRYHGVGTSDASAYGGSGHAFLINIHEQLCPSGPYVWDRDWFVSLVGNLGLVTRDLGFHDSSSTPGARAAVEALVRTHLDNGRPCSLLNMENQLIVGYDGEGFLLARPWDCAPDVTPGRLTYGTWAEFGGECHVGFFAFDRREPADDAAIARDALRAAVALYRGAGAIEGYRTGAGAYENWLAAVEEHGGSHGNWWNATVWSECRAMAAAWFEELAERLPASAGPARELARAYEDLAGVLARAGDKTLAPGEKLPLVAEAKELEAAAVRGIVTMLACLG